MGIWGMYLRGIGHWGMEHVDGGGKGGYLLEGRVGEGTRTRGHSGSSGPLLASPLMLVAMRADSVHLC